MTATSDITQFQQRLTAIQRRLQFQRWLEQTTVALLIASLTTALVLLCRYLVAPYPWWSLLLSGLPLYLWALLYLPHLASLSYFRQHRLAKVYFPLATTLPLLWTALAILRPNLLLLFPAWYIPIAISLFFLFTAFLVTPRITLRQAALFTDSVGQIPDQITSAYLASNHPMPPTADTLQGSFHSALLSDAFRQLSHVQLSYRSFTKLDHRYYLATALLMTGACWLLHFSPLLPPPVKSWDLHSLQPHTLHTLADTLKQMDNDPLLANDPKVQEALNPIRAILKQADGQQQMSNLEASARLEETRKKLDDLRRQNDDSDAQATLEQNQSTKNLSQAINKMKQDMAQQDTAVQKADSESLKQATDQLGKALASGQMSESDQKNLSETLKKAADQLDKKSDPASKKAAQAMKDAAAAAQAGDSKKMQESLHEAGSQMASSQGSSGSSSGANAGNSGSSGSAAAKALKDLEAAEAQMSAEDKQPGGSSQSAQGDNGSDGANSTGSQEASNGGNNAGQGDQGSQSGSGDNGASGDGPSDSLANGEGQGDQGGPSTPHSTNLKAPSHAGGEWHSHEVGKTGTFVKVYESHAIANQGPMHKATSPLDPNGKSGGSVTIRSLGDNQQAPLQDYSSQLPAARKLAEDAINRQQIPPQYKEMVRSYYEH